MTKNDKNYILQLLKLNKFHIFFAEKKEAPVLMSSINKVRPSLIFKKTRLKMMKIIFFNY